MMENIRIDGEGVQFRDPFHLNGKTTLANSDPPAFWREEPNSNRDDSPTRSAIDSVCYIADHLKTGEEDDAVIEDWKYVAMVLDRVFLWAFTLACAGGTFAIVLRAPTLYDDTPAIA